jgi:hypothetical protein
VTRLFALTLVLALGCGKTYDVEVGPHLVTCAGAHIRTCLNTRAEGDDWGPEYVTIRGFDYEWGRTYGLTIHETALHSRASDALSHQLDLVEERWSEAVDPDEAFELYVEGYYGEYNVDFDTGTIYGVTDKQFVCPDQSLCDKLDGSFDGYTWATFAFGDPIDGPLELIAVD